MYEEEMAIKGMLKVIVHYANKTIESMDDIAVYYSTDVANLKEIKKNMKTAAKTISKYSLDYHLKVITDCANDILIARDGLCIHELEDFGYRLEYLLDDVKDYIKRMEDYEKDDYEEDDDEEDADDDEEEDEG